VNPIKSLFALLFMLVATLFTASDAQAFALGNHAGGFFSGTLVRKGSLGRLKIQEQLSTLEMWQVCHQEVQQLC
jgi:hypothetical protein